MTSPATPGEGSEAQEPEHEPDLLLQEVAALTTALHAIDLRLKNTLSRDEAHKRLARAKAEVGVRRRRTLLLVLMLLVLGLQASDQHTETCRVGAIDNQILRPLNPKVQFFCDFTNPTHVHTFGNPTYPSVGNIAGIATYTLVFLGLALWFAKENERAWTRANQGLDPDDKEPVPPGAG